MSEDGLGGGGGGEIVVSHRKTFMEFQGQLFIAKFGRCYGRQQRTERGYIVWVSNLVKFFSRVKSYF